MSRVTRARLPERARLPALAALIGATLLLAGCSSQPSRTSGNDRLTEGLPASGASSEPGSSTGSETGAPSGGDGPGVSDTPDPALSDQPTPTVPPGDPGDGSADPAEPDDSSHGGKAPAVPRDALLDTASVGAVAGGDWTVSAAPSGWCAGPRMPGTSATRSQLLQSPDGRLVQSVSAYRDAAAALRAVAVATDRLVGCGFTRDRDPRLGEASELLTGPGTDGTQQVVLVLASEGVGLVLAASGSAAQAGTWDSLADLALGSSCAAAGHGCH
jgi:hypothetical protein